ncbi:hypothetical protein PIB30_079007 [Stylosanthes scabra]|uniref:PPM-type phosphatase domain-containing protein n=1 Tax=Stylosanthes scabra TaxID=79078 RepID=A0ABU6XST0_9FABA|nr:hypothetical protein [Stylosanthes scabra]
MGGCCSHELGGLQGRIEISELEDEHELEFGSNDIEYGYGGEIIRLKGCSRFVTMYSQQGKKGVNQDSMTVWEDYTGEKDMIFCGVFDGHGPLGHKVSQYIRDNLPSKRSAAIKLAQQKANNYYDDTDADTSTFGDTNNQQNMSLASWEGCFIKTFKEMDDYSLRTLTPTAIVAVALPLR